GESATRKNAAASPATGSLRSLSSSPTSRKHSAIPDPPTTQPTAAASPLRNPSGMCIRHDVLVVVGRQVEGCHLADDEGDGRRKQRRELLERAPEDLLAVTARRADGRNRRLRRQAACNDADRHAGGTEGARLLAAARHDEGIAALQAHDVPLAAELDEEVVDLVLAERALLAPQPDAVDLRRRRRERDDRIHRGTVVDDGLGPPDGLERRLREEIGITRSHADQAHAHRPAPASESARSATSQGPAYRPVSPATRRIVRMFTSAASRSPSAVRTTRSPGRPTSVTEATGASLPRRVRRRSRSRSSCQVRVRERGL